MAGYIGQAPANKFLTLDKQTFTTSATDTYSLDKTVSSANEIELFLNNVRQEPIEAYTVSGSTLTLASAITSSDTMYCIYQGKAIGTISPTANTISTDMIVNGAVTSAKLDSGLALGKIGQVVQATTSSQVGTTSTSYVDSNITASITPSSTSSKILVLVSANCFIIGSTATSMDTNIVRDSTVVAEFDRSVYKESSATASQIFLQYLDSPSTTSSTTYKVQIRRGSGTETILTQYSDANGSGISFITLMEILA